MYQNYCCCYVHFYLPCFLTKCLQNAKQNAVSDNLFSQFSGEDAPKPPDVLLPVLTFDVNI